jgi:hypothetical protein
MRAPTLAFLLLASLPNAGCLVVAAGAAGYGAVKYAQNEAARDYNADLTSTWVATLDTMREMGYPVSPGAPHGPTSGVIDIGDAHVSVAKHSESRTRVHVRIGTFDTDDHRRRANLLLSGIGRRLGQP